MPMPRLLQFRNHLVSLFVTLLPHLPLPSAMTWSPSAESLAKREGSHCMSCSEEKPRMTQLVRMATNTITRITSYHTPMLHALQWQKQELSFNQPSISVVIVLVLQLKPTTSKNHFQYPAHYIITLQKLSHILYVIVKAMMKYFQYSVHYTGKEKRVEWGLGTRPA